MSAIRAARTSAKPSTDLERTAWPELAESVVSVLRAAGHERHYAKGEVIFDVGQEGYNLVLVEEGCVAIIDRGTQRTVTEIAAGSFLGELGMLTGQKTFLACEAVVDSRVVVIPQEKVRDLVASVPEVADVIVSAFAARRRLLIEWGEGGLFLVGSEGDAEATALLEFASRNRIPFRFIDRRDREAVAEIPQVDDLPAVGTAVIIGERRVLKRPNPRDLSAALGLRLEADPDRTYDLAVIGAGPGGLAAAVYGASEGLSTVVIEDIAIGGQAGTSSRIENYLGFATGISGSDLAYSGVIQAVKFGAQIAAPRRATRLSEGRSTAGDRYWEIALDGPNGDVVRSRAVILANGVQYRKLPLDRLAQLEGAGVYYAATELEARFCRGTDAVIVGGGNSAGQAAMFLSRHARCTHVVVRGESLADTMSHYLTDRIARDERIALVTHGEIVKLHGDDRLEAVTLRDTETGEERVLQTRALFIMIGAVPHTDWLKGTLALDENGFILTGEAAEQTEPFATSRAGVFAVGDVRAGSIKRVASAVGEGSVAVTGVHRFLSDR